MPRDLANVKTKVAFNLTKRQLICFGAAALVGVPLFFVCLLYTSQKYGKTNTKEYLAKKKDLKYNEDEVQQSQIPSGLCG